MPTKFTIHYYPLERKTYLFNNSRAFSNDFLNMLLVFAIIVIVSDQKKKQLFGTSAAYVFTKLTLTFSRNREMLFPTFWVIN